MWSGWGFLLPLCGLIVIWVGVLLVLSGEATVGGILAFQMYLFMLLAPVLTLVQSYGQTQQGLAAMERVLDILRRPIDKPDRPGAIAAPRQVELHRIRPRRVRVSPGGDGLARPVAARARRRDGGARRSEWLGQDDSHQSRRPFLRPDGRRDASERHRSARHAAQSYRQRLALVQQDTFLFDGTIAENIAYWRKDATREQIEQAARRANAYDFVMSFPAGFATVVGERGVRLSGGQAQRISIALRDPGRSADPDPGRSDEQPGFGE